MTLKALEDGVVLAVDGKKFGAVSVRGFEDEFAGEDENLLRGEREILAGGERGERGFETGGADDSDEHDVGFGQLGEFGQAGGTGDEMSVGQKRFLMGHRSGAGGLAENSDVADAKFTGDRGEFLPLTVGGDADEFELVAVRREDAKRVLADGAGGAEEDDAFTLRKGGDGHA